MKTINISADVYAAIWRNHRQGEETEDEILKRLLLASGYAEAKPAVRLRKTNWIEDVVTGLGRIDGAGHLSAIYDSVLAVRKENGHRIPVSAEAIVRRTLEENSSQTESFKGKQDLFVAPNGIGAGFWALR
jgi:negative regulator of replication initiation